MQATVSSRQIGFGGLKRVFVAAIFAAGIAVGVAVPTAINHTPLRHAGRHAAILPRAYAGSQNPDLGEGRVGARTSAATAQLRAYPSVNQGDGLSGGNHDSLPSAITAHASAGMGEGWLGHGRPAAALQLAHTPMAPARVGWKTGAPSAHNAEAGGGQDAR
jgi:hypothetical protein